MYFRSLSISSGSPVRRRRRSAARAAECRSGGLGLHELGVAVAGRSLALPGPDPVRPAAGGVGPQKFDLSLLPWPASPPSITRHELRPPDESCPKGFNSRWPACSSGSWCRGSARSCERCGPRDDLNRCPPSYGPQLGEGEPSRSIEEELGDELSTARYAARALRI